MAYDDLKDFQGEAYIGMAVGGEHTWLYPNGLWRETKVAPDRWEFTFASLKERERSAPAGSGVPVGTQYHWYILANQRVRKIDADTYTTFMAGLKYKIAHKRPHWRRWSSEYPDQQSDQERTVAALEEALARLRKPRLIGEAQVGKTLIAERDAPTSEDNEDEAMGVGRDRRLGDRRALLPPLPP